MLCIVQKVIFYNKVVNGFPGIHCLNDYAVSFRNKYFVLTDIVISYRRNVVHVAFYTKHFSTNILLGKNWFQLCVLLPIDGLIKLPIMASVSTYVCVSLFSLINVDMPRRPDVVFGDAFVFSPVQSRLKKC